MARKQAGEDGLDEGHPRERLFGERSARHIQRSEDHTQLLQEFAFRFPGGSGGGAAASGTRFRRRLTYRTGLRSEAFASVTEEAFMFEEHAQKREEPVPRRLAVSPRLQFCLFLLRPRLQQTAWTGGVAFKTGLNDTPEVAKSLGNNRL